MQKYIDKPWGHEIIWAQAAGYVGKILFIKQGSKLSRQYHKQKEETFLVKKGKLLLEIGDNSTVIESLYLNEGASFHCPPNTVHRMIGITDVEVIEVSTNHLDDVVRLEDDYGRNSCIKKDS